jgi:hypothetical protein
MRTVTTLFARLAIATLAMFASLALADPPTRAIRLASVAGPVSFLPSGETDWLQARINRPLWTGDRLWTDRGARAELQIGGAAIFAAPESSLAVLAYDDDRAQFEITQGTVEIFVRSLGRNDTIEIDTPHLAFVVRVPGRYRIDVRNDGESTAVAVVRGEGEAFGTRTAYMLRAGQGYRFYGADLADYDAEPVRVAGAFDTWVDGRVRNYERSQSARYVSTDMVGYADLDAYGTWRNVANYGAVWVPTRVETGWAPYRYGHWSWVEPWGWTWIDDAPWGFAPFHYGRWAHVDNRYWAWVPGPRNAAPVYAPALVAFVGGANFSASVSSGPGVAWFPLAPGEVYRPGYNASREYFTRVNVTNTVVNVNNVTNVYNNPRTEVRYVNINNANAVTAVPTQAFVQSQPVQRAAVRMNRDALQAAQVVASAPVAPVRASVNGAAPPAQARPDQRVVDRKVMVKEAPPPAPQSVEHRQEAMKQQPGKPVDRADVAKGAPPRQNVTVVQAAPAAQPIPAPQPGERGKGRERNAPEQAKAPPPPAQQPASTPPPMAQPAPAQPPQVAQPAPSEQRRGGPPEDRGRNAARGQPEAPPQPAAKAPEPQRPTVAAPPPVQQTAPPAQPPQVAQPAPNEQRRGGPPEDRGRNASRGQPEAPPHPAAKAPEPQRPTVAAPPPVQQAAPPALSPQVAQPAPNEQRRGGPPEDRGRNASRGQPEAPAQPAAKAPEPARPAPGAPPPVQRAQPQRAPDQPSAAAPPPPHEAAPAQQQQQQEPRGKKNRDDDGDKKGKGRD